MKYLVALMVILLPNFTMGQIDDWRLISNGLKIYEHGYCDQPYIVVTEDGTWVCTFTTAPGQEGDAKQYIVSTYSSDQGRTWSRPIEIEDAGTSLEASWAMPLITHFDRIYVFYTFNGDSIRSFPDGTSIRADTHGWYCYRYSDDHGISWSKRYRLEMRITACDRKNDFLGEVQMFWGIGKPVTKGTDAWFSFTKLGKYFLEEGEGWIYYSNNILTEKDVSKVTWQMLPEGDLGIRSSELGSVQEEFNIQPLNSKDGLYCVFRTTQGQPAESYSHDNGKSWTEPALVQYANGMPLRNPRACPRIWKCRNGKYLLWYHNNGANGFAHRNPAWVAGGIERDGKILWSQPEILIHGPDRSYETGRFSYPDLVEEDGRYWISTTQKTAATLHEVPAHFFEMLWGQFEDPKPTSQSTVASFENIQGTNRHELSAPLNLSEDGFSLDFWITIDRFSDAIIFDGGDSTTKNCQLHLRHDGVLEFSLSHNGEFMTLTSDRNRLVEETRHHVAILFDANAKICYMMIDGSICDGGGHQVFGFQWITSALSNLEIQNLSIRRFSGKMESLKIYGEQMSTSQFVHNFNLKK